MIAFLQNPIERLDAVYEDRPYLELMRARLLAFFSMMVVGFVPLNVLKLLWLQPPELPFRFAVNAIFLTAALFALRWVYKGRIRIAGNGLALIIFLPVHALLFFVPTFHQPLAVAISLLSFGTCCTLIALVFASRSVAFVLFVLTIATQFTFHYALLSWETIPGSLEYAAGALMRESLITTAFIFGLGVTLAMLIENAHRRSEETLTKAREMNENLEQIVADRTRDLTAATDQANQASQAKGEFLANMSHEIRTPLHAIIATSELLLSREDLPPDAAEKSRIIAEAGDLLIKQIGDILDISKIEAGQIELENAPFFLQATMGSCVTLMTPKAEEAGVNLDWSISPDLPPYLTGDSFRLRQVLLNLLSNAIKFTPAKGQVTLSATPDGRDADCVRIRFVVKDSGIGMDEAAQQRIFERYSQAAIATSRQFGGTGLGLAICTHLVELMDGQLAVESTLGEGSTFFFTIPLAVTENAASPFAGESTGFDKLGLNILVADDNPTNRKIIGLQLEKLGCQYSLKCDGNELLTALETEPLPDLVLVDCEMPNMDGWEATRQLRSWATDPNASATQKAAAKTPVIALTAATSPEDRARCTAAGMDDFLAKPIKLASLHWSLRSHSPGERTPA